MILNLSLAFRSSRLSLPVALFKIFLNLKMWMQSRYDHEVKPWETKDESFKITVDGFEEP